MDEMNASRVGGEFKECPTCNVGQPRPTQEPTRMVGEAIGEFSTLFSKFCPLADYNSLFFDSRITGKLIFSRDFNHDLECYLEKHLLRLVTHLERCLTVTMDWLLVQK
jgi:hypothetical protein